MSRSGVRHALCRVEGQTPARGDARAGRRDSKEGAEAFGWSTENRKPTTENSKRIGKGVAAQVWPTGGGPPAYALLRVNPDGTIDVLAGTQDLGTGARTVLSQIAAESIGAPGTGTPSSPSKRKSPSPAPGDSSGSEGISVGSVSTTMRGAMLSIRWCMYRLHGSVRTKARLNGAA